MKTRLDCDSILFSGDDDYPSHLLVVTCLVHERSSEPIRDTQEFHILYTPKQIRGFLQKHKRKLGKQSRKELKRGRRDLKKAGYKKQKALHTYGHHARDLAILAMVVLENSKSETPEPEETIH